MTQLVRRRLRYAWLEYQDHSDGVMFDSGMRRLGARNILLSLPLVSAEGGRRRSANLKGMDVRSLRFGSVQGTIARPSSADEAFLGKWVLNPGVQGGKLTHEDTENQADILAVSGHGSDGLVWGTGHPSRDENMIRLSDLIKVNRAMPSSGRLKYLLNSACFNMSEEAALYWKHAFERTKPLRGILGYEEGYSGGAVGAAVMRDFTRLLRTKPEQSIIESWQEANEGVRKPQPWAALFHELAVGDTFADLRDGLLEDAAPADAIVHFGKSNPRGVRVNLADKGYEVRFVMADGTSLSHENNRFDSNNGLFVGQPGSIALRATRAHVPFRRGDTIHVLVYFFRPRKPGMDLTKLLQFDPALLKPDPRTGRPTVSLLTDGNNRKDDYPNSKVDGFAVHVQADTQEIKLDFHVPTQAATHFPEDPPRTHGRFSLAIFPPNVDSHQTDRVMHFYPDGVWLR